MIKLINTKLIAKLMKEVAKECGMTRLYSSTDDIWWAKAMAYAKSNDYFVAREMFEKYRRVVKAYDFIADNFVELLEAKVKAEGFELADNGITFTSCPNDEVDYPAAKKKYGKKYFLVRTADYPRKDHYLKGGTYVRLTVSFIGPRQYKNSYTVTPIDID